MNETLTAAIDVLGQLQLETGGPLLGHIVSLRHELVIERQRRIEVLRESGLSDEQISPSTNESSPESRANGCARVAS